MLYPLWRDGIIRKKDTIGKNKVFIHQSVFKFWANFFLNETLYKDDSQLTNDITERFDILFYFRQYV